MPLLHSWFFERVLSRERAILSKQALLVNEGAKCKLAGVRIVFFDGVCKLCNAAVNFIIDQDPRGNFHFLALQNAAALLAEHGYTVTPPGPPQSILLLEDGKVFTASTAALRIARGLRAPWSYLAWGLWIPRPARDLVYRFIATHRYRWFGKTQSCCVPTAGMKARFL